MSLDLKTIIRDENKSWPVVKESEIALTDIIPR